MGKRRMKNMLNENITKKNKRVAIYVRVSDFERHMEGYDVCEQLLPLREWCKKHGYEVYKEYLDDGVKGILPNSKKPALQRLLEDIQNNEFEMVLVWKLNRLTRTIKELIDLIDYFDDNQINFQTYYEGFETKTASGRFQFEVFKSIRNIGEDLSKNINGEDLYVS
jgi:site-specific DNA recombinase